MSVMTGKVAKALAIGAAFSIIEPALRERYNRSEPREPLVWAPASSQKVMLKNAEIVDVAGGMVLHKRGLLMQDGRITDIVTEKKLHGIGADKVIDVEGLHVIPGLINAHCHISLPLVLTVGAGIPSRGRKPHPSAPWTCAM